VSRRTLLALGVLLAIVSLALSATGGFVTSVLAVRFSSRSPQPAAIAAAAVLGAWLVIAWRAGAVREDAASVETWLVRHARVLVVAIAAIAGAIAIRYGSFSAASSDPSGYLSQAAMLQRGQLERVEPLAALADWPDAQRTLAPLGWRPARDLNQQVPTYPVGLSLLMTPGHATGGPIGASLIIPFSFALAVYTTGALALRIAGPPAAILAAGWLATSPVALIEAMQPMSDVPVTAAWLVCWVSLIRSRRDGDVGAALAAGAAAAVGVLMRPNLAPLAILPACFVIVRSSRPWRAVSEFSAPVALAGLVVGYLHWRWFGSPLRSGYGTASEIYAVAGFVPNLQLYVRWLVASHGPWLLLAPLALVWPWRFAGDAGSSTTNATDIRWLLVFAAGVVAAYLFWNVFDVWTYLRFLLPALAIAMVAVTAMIVSVIARMPAAARGPVVVIVTLALMAANVATAQSLDVFRFARVQSRAVLAGRYLDAVLPGDAVVIAGEQSGSVRYYTNRSIVRWDLAAAGGLDEVCARLDHLGRDIWIALDVWEEELFRRKFPRSAAGAIDWPPRVEAGTDMLMRAWRLRDREPFMREGKVVTDRLR
jgi:hypothetical protein